MVDSDKTDIKKTDPEKADLEKNSSGISGGSQDASTSVCQGSLKNQFLIATPNLDTGIFKSSVTYICEHNEDGAMGIIINRPSTMRIEDVLADVAELDASELESEALQSNGPVMVGGPIGLERGFVLHQSAHDDLLWSSSLRVASDIVLTGSRDILLAMCEGRGPKNYLLALGYAGWGAGQLEQELAENSWLTLPANSDIIFSTPIQERAQAAIDALGIDIAALATTSGNA